LNQKVNIGIDFKLFQQSQKNEVVSCVLSRRNVVRNELGLVLLRVTYLDNPLFMLVRHLLVTTTHSK
jgi:hypothetical protein